MLSNFHKLMRCSSSVLQPSTPVGGRNAGGGVVGYVSDAHLSFNINNDDPNIATCSGRGDCLNGTCLCDIRYAGDECSGFNLPYYAGISTVFYFVALVSVIQLFICIIAEYQRLKQPSILRACRLTTQKVLYFMVFVAASLRGAFFTTPVSNVKEEVKEKYFILNLIYCFVSFPCCSWIYNHNGLSHSCLRIIQC